jgi:hypothetical protein
VRFAAWSGIVLGVSMALQWSVFLATGQVPELQTEPWRIGFHLAAEAATAAALIVGGVLLLRGHARGRAVALVANGMLVYTAIVSPGYFAQAGQWALVAMFAVVLALALASIAALIRGGESLG